MFFRTTLKRDKKEFSQNRSVKQQITNSIKKLNNKDPILFTPSDFNIFIPLNYINQFDQKVLKTNFQNKLSAPINYKLLRYPAAVDQQLTSRAQSVKHRDIGYAYDLFWFFSNSKLIIWKYQDKTQQKFWIQQQLNSSVLVQNFDTDITCVSYGKFLSSNTRQEQWLMVFVIAFEKYLKLYKLVDDVLVDMKIDIPTFCENIHKIIFSSEGDIFYGGDRGEVKLIKNYSSKKKQPSLKYIISGGILFGYLQIENPLEQFQRFKTEIKVKKIILNQRRNRLYCFLRKTHQDLWILKRLQEVFGWKYKPKERFIKIYDTSKNINYSHQFSQQQFIQKFKIKYSQYQSQDELNLQIKDIFLHTSKQTNQLGIALKNGCMVTLKNTRLILFNLIQHPYRTIDTAPNNKLILYKSLGLNSLSCYGNIFAYSNGIEFNTYTKAQSKLGYLFKKESQQLKKLQNKLFEAEKQFYFIHSDGIDYFSRIKLNQIILMYLDIQNQINIEFHKKINCQKLLQPISQAYGIVLLCANLIQIICNPYISLQIFQNVYTRTKIQVYKLNNMHQPKPDTYIQIRRKIINSPQIRQLAHSTLKQYENIVINYNQQIIQMPGMSKILDGFSMNLNDTLWHSVLFYFYSIYDQIKDKPIDFFHQEKRFVLLCIDKLTTFQNFLQSKCFGILGQLSSIQTQKKTLQSDKIYSKTLRDQAKLSNYIQNTTLQLMKRIKIFISKIKKIIYVFPNLIFNKKYKKQITLSNLFSDEQVKQNFRNRLFQSVDLNDRYLIELSVITPQILCPEHIIYENWRKKQKSQTVNISIAVKILDFHKMKQIEENYYQKNLYFQFIKVVMSKLYYIDKCKKQLQQSIKQKENNPTLFNKLEINQLKQQMNNILTLQPDVTSMSLKTLQIMIINIKNTTKQKQNQIQILQKSIIQISKSSKTKLIDQVINLLKRFDMTLELKLVRGKTNDNKKQSKNQQLFQQF